MATISYSNQLVYYMTAISGQLLYERISDDDWHQWGNGLNPPHSSKLIGLSKMRFLPRIHTSWKRGRSLRPKLQQHLCGRGRSRNESHEQNLVFMLLLLDQSA